MHVVEYGNPDGRVVIYLHGVPRNIEECAYLIVMQNTTILGY